MDTEKLNGEGFLLFLMKNLWMNEIFFHDINEVFPLCKDTGYNCYIWDDAWKIYEKENYVKKFKIRFKFFIKGPMNVSLLYR